MQAWRNQGSGKMEAEGQKLTCSLPSTAQGQVHNLIPKLTWQAGAP